jgi:hypothetical protein
MVLRAVAVGLLSVLGIACARSAPIKAPTVIFVDGVSGGSLSTSEESSERDAGSWKAKDEVEVEWRGAWWPAVIMEKRGPRWLVHYEGYGTDWDEVVSQERIRERRAELDAEGGDEPDDEPDP